VPGIEPRLPDLLPRTLTTRPQRRSIDRDCSEILNFKFEGNRPLRRPRTIFLNQMADDMRDRVDELQEPLPEFRGRRNSRYFQICFGISSVM
jgi:hypothetical protein